MDVVRPVGQWVALNTPDELVIRDANEAAVGVGVGRAERSTFVLGPSNGAST